MKKEQKPKEQEQKKVDSSTGSPKKVGVEVPENIDVIQPLEIEITKELQKRTVEGEPVFTSGIKVEEKEPDLVGEADIAKIKKEMSPHLMEQGVLLFTEELMKQATYLVKSGLLPKDVNTPEKAIIIMQKGRELGFEAMASFEHVIVIGGRATLDGIGMMTLLRKGGVEWETVRDYDVIYVIDGVRKYASDLRKEEKAVPEGCKMVDAETVIRFFRPSKVAEGGYRKEEVKFTYKEAATAGLLSKDSWRKYLRLMLWWRTFAPGARRVAGDLTMGMLSPEEADDSGTVYLEESGAVKVIKKR